MHEPFYQGSSACCPLHRVEGDSFARCWPSNALPWARQSSRAGYVCTDFFRHENVAIRGRQGRLDVFALPLR